MKPGEARRKFRKAVRVVLMNNAMNKVAVEYEERDTLLSFTAFAEKCKSNVGTKETQTDSLTFDKKYFKARKEFRLSQDVKDFLTIGVKDRTPQQLKQVLYCLQYVKSFSEYPLYMQERLCKVAFYHIVPPKRVIIRQGHTAESFYTLLSGQVIVTRLETDPVTKETVHRTVNVLRRGACFGELALIHQSKRTATVTSDVACELLSIGREDFHNIFMRAEEPGKDPQHIKFIRSMPFLRKWPVNLLLKEPEMCLFHYYKRSTVICMDSNNSDWLYIVKSGTCQVIKQLKDVKPLSWRPQTTRLYTTGEDGRYAKNGANTLPKIDTGRQRPQPPSLSFDMMSDILNYRAWSRVNPSSPRRTGSLDDDKSEVPLLQTEDTMLSELSGVSSFDFSDTPSTMTSPRSPDKSYLFQGRRHSDNRKTVFVQLDTIHAGEVFGLTNLCYEQGLLDYPQPTVSLVSRGAECIMLNKAFFIKNVSVYEKQSLKAYCRPYPLQDALQDRLQDLVNWQRYKQQTMQTAVKEHLKIMI